MGIPMYSLTLNDHRDSEPGTFSLSLESPNRVWASLESEALRPPAAARSPASWILPVCARSATRTSALASLASVRGFVHPLMALHCSESQLAFRRRSPPATRRPSSRAMAGSLRNVGSTQVLVQILAHLLPPSDPPWQRIGSSRRFPAKLSQCRSSTSSAFSEPKSFRYSGRKQESRSLSASRPADSNLSSHSCHRKRVLGISHAALPRHRGSC